MDTEESSILEHREYAVSLQASRDIIKDVKKRNNRLNNVVGRIKEFEERRILFSLELIKIRRIEVNNPVDCIQYKTDEVQNRMSDF